MKQFKGIFAFALSLMLFALVSFVTHEPKTTKSESVESVQGAYVESLEAAVFTVVCAPSFESTESLIPKATHYSATINYETQTKALEGSFSPIAFLPVDVGKYKRLS